MLRASPRQDWYLAERELLVPISAVPGLYAPKRGLAWDVHRSHLPLLDDQTARRILANVEKPDWAARDRATADRGFKLRDAQHGAVDFILPRRGVLIGDDMRVGKTLSAMMSHDPKTGPLMIGVLIGRTISTDSASAGTLSSNATDWRGKITTIGSNTTTLTFGDTGFTDVVCSVATEGGTLGVGVEVTDGSTTSIFNCYTTSTGAAVNCPTLGYQCIGR